MSASMPTADEIFDKPWPAIDDDDGLVFDDVGDLDNPLAVPLVATLRALRKTQQTQRAFQTVLKQATELLHDQHRELQGLRRRNRELLDEVRAHRKATAA